MSGVTEEELLHLAHLCRIHVSREKRAAMLDDFQHVVSYVHLLSEVDTEGVEPCHYVVSGQNQTPLREDVAENTLNYEDFAQNVPESIAKFVRVPTVINAKEG